MSEVDPKDQELAQLREQLAQAQSRAASLEGTATNERQGRIAAERRTMSEAELRVVSQQESCENAILAGESEADALEAQIVSLQTEGRFAEAGKVVRQLTQIEAKLVDQRNRKDWLEGERLKVKSATANHEAAIASQPAVDNRVLADGRPLASFNGSPMTKAWLERNPRAFTDKVFLAKVMARHYEMVADDIQPETNEYIAGFDQKFSQSSGDQAGRAAADALEQSGAGGGDLDYQVRSPQGRAAGVGSLGGAPPSRSIPGVGAAAGGSSRPPALSSDEREVADSLYEHIPNPADRYRQYKEDQEFMNRRQGVH